MAIDKIVISMACLAGRIAIHLKKKTENHDRLKSTWPVFSITILSQLLRWQIIIQDTHWCVKRQTSRKQVVGKVYRRRSSALKLQNHPCYNKIECKPGIQQILNGRGAIDCRQVRITILSLFPIIPDNLLNNAGKQLPGTIVVQSKDSCLYKIALFYSMSDLN